ncbi:hypothetical protein IQ26_04084 [Mesorhizobium tianshanense]|uniref:Uncharacterized protein n=1 Tax=Mesorhizobium tianshanense TaxID=39844 RepID=A0A562NLM5_9HYPH|nr:hypothetical protein IQ26_04084 [Mesorhizobium tianshanense]
MAEASNPLMVRNGSIVPFAMHVEDNYNRSASTAGDCCACPASDPRAFQGKNLAVATKSARSSSCSMCEPIGLLPDHVFRSRLVLVPTLDPASAQVLGGFTDHMSDRLRKCPNMPFRVPGSINTIPIQLVFRLLDNFSSGQARCLAMLVYSMRQFHIDRLRVSAADRKRAGDILRPLGINDQIGVAKSHF